MQKFSTEIVLYFILNRVICMKFKKNLYCLYNMHCNNLILSTIKDSYEVKSCN